MATPQHAQKCALGAFPDALCNCDLAARLAVFNRAQKRVVLVEDVLRSAREWAYHVEGGIKRLNNAVRALDAHDRDEPCSLCEQAHPAHHACTPATDASRREQR